MSDQKVIDAFTKSLLAIGCAFTVANGRVEVTGGNVDLPSLTTLPECTTFSNSGYVYLSSLTTLPEGTTFSNGGNVYLSSLTTLPEGATFSNGGSVYLGSLTTGDYPYAGQIVRLEHIDGYTMLIRSERQIGEYTVQSCRYFGGGDLDKLKACYVARAGGYTAHGDSAETAIRDVRFKVMQADFDVNDLVAAIKRRKTIEFNDFRLLTGACAEGLRHGLEQAGIAADTDVLPLDAALKAAHGPYGAAFKRLFAEA